MIPTQTIDALEDTFGSLTSILSTLTEDQWKTKTRLPGWNVQDNVSHLIGFERVIEGFTPTTHRSANYEYLRNPLGENNEHEVDVRRALPGSEILQEWMDISTKRMSTLHQATDEYFAQETVGPTGIGTMAEFLHVRVLDCWMHEQDIRDAVNMPGHQSGIAAEITIDRLTRTIPIVVGKRAQTPEGASVVIEITGPVIRHIVTTVKDGRAHFDDSGQVVATIKMDSSTFVQLAGGRVQYEDVAANIFCNGDNNLCLRMLTQFSMMI